MEYSDSHVQKQRCQQALATLRAGDREPMQAWLRDHLFHQVLPFWERHGIDPAGGLQTCLADDGSVLSTEKWMWSQWRAVWVFSRLYNRLDHDPRWLKIARHIVEFCSRHAWCEGENGWALLLSQEGKILRGRESIYSDAFAASGLFEYYQATQDPDALQLMHRSIEAALPYLEGPHDRIPHFPYPIPPGAKAHGVPMIWSLILAEIGAATQNERYLDVAARMSAEIFHDFYRADRDVLLEFIRADGTEYPGPHGAVVVPGHVIEDMWFQLHASMVAGDKIVHPANAYRLILRHLDLGWDTENAGGLLLAVNAHGGNPVAWNYHESKLWWPHTEILYAALLSWSDTNETVFLDWYERTWKVCLDHYVDWENGEWRQKLDRHFRPVNETVALPVKDPFHLPRSLILQIELLAKPVANPTVKNSSSFSS